MAESRDGTAWAKFRLAVDDRTRSVETGEWETSQTVFHDVVVFGKVAERTVGALRSGDAVLVQGEFRFQSYRSADGRTRTGISFVASRICPDILPADVTVSRDRAPTADRSHEVSHEAQPPPPDRPL